MYNLISSVLISLSIISAIIVISGKDVKGKNTISAYYNSKGSFAGFIQKKEGLIRACEFSSNGSILSCSKWFEEFGLKQGQNEGIDQENI
mgnify:CR=1 FL=1